MKTHIAFAALIALAQQGFAQQVAKPHPADPAAPVPATKYDSSFSGYRSFREEPIASWHAVNDDVARAGGHAGIFGGGGHGKSHPQPKPPAPATPPAARPAHKHGTTH